MMGYLKLDLGCGGSKRAPDFVGIDRLDSSAVDIVGDALEVLRALPTRSVGEVFAAHFIEHVDDPRALLAAVRSTLVPGGTVTLVAPHFSNPYFYSDPTHRSFFGLYTMCYWVRSELFRHRVPKYDDPIDLDLVSVDLTFKSGPPFYVRHGFKRVIGAIFNASYGMKAFYEEMLTWMFPCYEVTYVLRAPLEPVSAK